MSDFDADRYAELFGERPEGTPAAKEPTDAERRDRFYRHQPGKPAANLEDKPPGTPADKDEGGEPDNQDDTDARAEEIEARRVKEAKQKKYRAAMWGDLSSVAANARAAGLDGAELAEILRETAAEMAGVIGMPADDDDAGGE